jgi:hypothetical protein
VIIRSTVVYNKKVVINNTRAIQKVTSNELLTKQAMRKNYYIQKNTYIHPLVGGWSPAGSTRNGGHWLVYCTCPGWLWRRIWWNEDWQGKLVSITRTPAKLWREDWEVSVRWVWVQPLWAVAEERDSSGPESKENVRRWKPLSGNG